MTKREKLQRKLESRQRAHEVAVKASERDPQKGYGKGYNRPGSLNRKKAWPA